jgi:L-lactate dehydrogenase complex protein LldG
MSETNTAARNRILAKVRRSLGVAEGDGAREARVADRLASHPRQPTPARALLPQAELRAQFMEHLRRGQAHVNEVADLGGVPQAIATYLRESNKPLRVRMGSDPWLAGLPWGGTPALTRLSGRADPSDEVTLSRALAAASETGTLMLASGPDNPVTLSFLPETHLVVLDASTLKGSYEDALAVVRAALPNDAMPRTLNLISGPSRTADIGGKTVMGAHGPRMLAVFLVG